MTSMRSRRAQVPRRALQVYFVVVSTLVLGLASLHVYRGEGCSAPPGKFQAGASGALPSRVAGAATGAP